MRAFSKFCRLIVSIEFPPLGPHCITITAYDTAKDCPAGGRGVLDSEVAGEALSVPHASGTVTGSSTAICLCLSSEAGSVGDLVACPLPAQPDHRGDGEGATAACAAIHWAGALQSSIASGDLSFGLASVGAKHGSVVCG